MLGGVTSLPRKVVLEFDLEDAKDLSHGMADLLCWCRGWMAAATESSEHGPMGVDDARELNIRLKRAIEKAQEP